MGLKVTNQIKLTIQTSMGELNRHLHTNNSFLKIEFKNQVLSRH